MTVKYPGEYYYLGWRRMVVIEGYDPILKCFYGNTVKYPYDLPVGRFYINREVLFDLIPADSMSKLEKFIYGV